MTKTNYLIKVGSANKNDLNEIRRFMMEGGCGNHPCVIVEHLIEQKHFDDPKLLCYEVLQKIIKDVAIIKRWYEGDTSLNDSPVVRLYLKENVELDDENNKRLFLEDLIPDLNPSRRMDDYFNMDFFINGPHDEGFRRSFNVISVYDLIERGFKLSDYDVLK